jgi:hypothetical protein
MPAQVLPAPPTNAPPGAAPPANNVVPFSRQVPSMPAPPPSAGASVPGMPSPLLPGAATAATGSAIGLGPIALGAALGTAGSLAAASGLSGVPPGDILKAGLPPQLGGTPEKGIDPGKFGLPNLPDLSGQPLPSRLPDGTLRPGTASKQGIPRRTVPSQPTFPFTGGQVPGRNYQVTWTYTVPGTVLNGGGSSVLLGPVGGVIVTGGGGLLNYGIQHAGGVRAIVSVGTDQAAVVTIGSVVPVDGLADGPGNPPALFVPSPEIAPQAPPAPVQPTSPPAPGAPEPGKEPQPRKVPPPFSEPVPFRRPSRQPDEDPQPVPPPSPPEREPDRIPPPPLPEPNRPGTSPETPVTPAPGTPAPGTRPAPKTSPPGPGEEPKPSTVPPSPQWSPPLFDPAPQRSPGPLAPEEPDPRVAPGTPTAPAGVPPLPPRLPGTGYPGLPSYDPDGNRLPGPTIPAPPPPFQPPAPFTCCEEILDAIAKFRQSAEDKLEENQTSLEKLEKFCIPVTASKAEVGLAVCQNSAVLSIGNNTYAVRFNTCTLDGNLRSEFGGDSAPSVDYLGWYAFSDTIYGGGDRHPIQYKEQVVFPPVWARYISFTYKGTTTGSVFARTLTGDGSPVQYRSEQLFRAPD